MNTDDSFQPTMAESARIALTQVNLSPSRSGFDLTLADRNAIHLTGVQADLLIVAVRAGKIPGMKFQP